MALVAWMVLAGGVPTSSAEGTTAAFLKLPASPRQAALGGAQTALSHGPASAFFNPAGLSGPRQLFASDARLFADTRYDTFALGLPTSPGSARTLGISVGYLSQGAIESRGADRGPAGSFRASDLVVGLSYARPVFAGARLGGTVKMIRSQIADVRATGWAADVGVLGETGVEGLAFGLAARNLGPSMTFLNEGSQLPTGFSAGLSWQAGPMTVAGDLTRRLADDKTRFSLGAELPVFSALSVRAGYATSAAALVSRAGAGLAGGFGLKVLGSRLDYSFTPMGELGSAQRISLSVGF